MDFADRPVERALCKSPRSKKQQAGQIVMRGEEAGHLLFKRVRRIDPAVDPVAFDRRL